MLPEFDRSSGVVVGGPIHGENGAILLDLQEAGLVRRSADPDDRRSQLVVLSDRGAQVGQAYRDTVAAGIADLVADIPAAELETLRKVMSRIVLAHQARNTWPSENDSAA